MTVAAGAAGASLSRAIHGWQVLCSCSDVGDILAFPIIKDKRRRKMIEIMEIMLLLARSDPRGKHWQLW